LSAEPDEEGVYHRLMAAARPIRIAIVGSGPAGFYAAGQLLASDLEVEVDMFERLPTPWGLVRLGVAPDHPNIKAVSRVFEKIAAKPGFRFLGNVEIGRDLAHDELMRLYDGVVYSFGAQTDRRMGIPGEDLPGSWPATAFVAWYNGHPDFQDLEFDLDCERVVVVGNGNVAVDVARMLALTHDELAPTDTADPAIAAICGCRIREIVVLGRRGPAQAAFTNPELVELTELAGADLIIDPADLELDAASEAAAADDVMAQRNLEVMRAAAAKAPEGRARSVTLRFLTSPVELTGDGRVESVEVVRNRLEDDGSGRIVAVPTDERETIPCGLVLRSVGYLGVPIPGLPFDERRGVIPNDNGRVVGEDGSPIPGLYTAGWIKRGPSGVIGTNKKDATETIELLLADAASGVLPRADATSADVDALLASRNVEVVTHAGWQRIDEAERAAGETQGRPRVKLCSWDDLLEAARG
jgi:ferredoxin--NADP+ reductase